MSRAIEIIMELASCSEDDAQRVYAETNNVEDAVDKLLPQVKVIHTKRPSRTYTDEELQFKKLRMEMKKLDAEHDKRAISMNLNQRGSVEQVEQSNHLEEMVPQSSYYQECQLPSLQSEVQKPEIACQSPSGCSCGSPSSVQTLHGSAHQCDQYCQALG
jgi:hypothetical protein